MTIDDDNSVSLPTPPPPRPAARHASIEAALRKFDDVKESSAGQDAWKRPQRAAWPTLQKRQLGALATAALVAVISIPVALIVLRDQPPERLSTPPAPITVEANEPNTCLGPDCVGRKESSLAIRKAPDSDGAKIEVQASPATSSGSATVALERHGGTSAMADEPAAASSQPAAPAAAPPPPSPPPPPAPAAREEYAGEAGTQDMVVTGSRIRSPDLSSQNDARALAKSGGEAAAPLLVVDPYGEFLSRLKADLRVGNRRAIVSRTGFPLRVNRDGKTRIYRSSAEVERDFEQIFSPQVKAAILGQRRESLTSRDGGRLMGNGRVWFGQSCPGQPCPPAAPVLIREINP